MTVTVLALARGRAWGVQRALSARRQTPARHLRVKVRTELGPRLSPRFTTTLYSIDAHVKVRDRELHNHKQEVYPVRYPVIGNQQTKTRNKTKQTSTKQKTKQTKQISQNKRNQPAKQQNKTKQTCLIRGAVAPVQSRGILRILRARRRPPGTSRPHRASL